MGRRPRRAQALLFLCATAAALVALQTRLPALGLASLGNWRCFQQVYCINLEHRKERWAYMERQFRQLGLPVQRWPAVDGRNLDVKKLVQSGELGREAMARFMLPDDQKVFGIDLTPGALGCALSHMQIWIDIMQRNGRGELSGDERSETFLVVEDDCQFLPAFSEEAFVARMRDVPPDWQLLFLGGVDSMGMQALLQVAPGVRRVYNGSRETTAYVINVQGARAALEVCFPLTWQLDTQLTLVGEPCGFDPELYYVTKPMGYVFWPPLVEQNKEDFATDVQKDEHPRYMYQNDRTNYSVALEEVLDEFEEEEQNMQLAEFSEKRHFSLAGNWDDWRGFVELSERTSGGLWAEVQVKAGEVVQFQLVCDRDWNQRLFPTPTGDILLGPSSAAHGNNWKLQAPYNATNLQIVWEPRFSQHPIQYSFCEESSVALSRRYALLGSWNGWTALLEFEQSGTSFFAEVDVEEDVEFQIVCDGDETQRIYPSPTGGKVLGPNEEGRGKVWKIKKLHSTKKARVAWEPLGARRISIERLDWEGRPLLRAEALREGTER